MRVARCAAARMCKVLRKIIRRTMVTKATEKAPSINVRAPTAEEWKRAKQRGLAPIWMAALLSLNILPLSSRKNFDAALLQQNAEAYKAYLRRRTILEQNYGHHERLPIVNHRSAQKTKYGEIVKLFDFCQFAHERELEGASEMIGVFCPELHPSPIAVAQSAGASLQVGDLRSKEEQENAGIRPPKSSPVDEDEWAMEITSSLARLPEGAMYVADLGKGARYSAYALGALATLLQEALLDPRVKATQYLQGKGNLNMTEIARRLAKILKANDVKTMGDRAHDPKTLAKHLSSAKKLLHSGKDAARQ